jgi:Tfp pilus assembly protein PilX
MRSTVLSRLRSLRSSDEHGVALVMVLIVTTIVTLLTVAGSAFALKQLKQVGRDQNWGAALAAAEAGETSWRPSRRRPATRRKAT